MTTLGRAIQSPRVCIEVRVLQGKKVLLKYRKTAVLLSLARMWFAGAKRIIAGYW